LFPFDKISSRSVWNLATPNLSKSFQTVSGDNRETVEEDSFQPVSEDNRETGEEVGLTQAMSN
jgi:hypothetical protein